MMEAPRYYVPHSSRWPIIGSSALAVLAFGAVHFIQQSTDKVETEASFGAPIFYIGLALIAYMFFGWFRTVISESVGGMNSKLLDRSFRMGMAWFIVSEIMFFAAFFGALFYARLITVPWLAGAGTNLETHVLLWPDFADTWPLFMTPGGTTTEAMEAWGLPFINTCILVTSSVTVTFAHWALKKNQRLPLAIWLGLTVALGISFLTLQVVEYMEAYNELGLTLGSGIYGSTFFMLTGFHGAHVTMGTIMLFVILLRCLRGHFSPENHFGFEAASWYWHFVDVVWLFLFTFVYWF
ncbi:MAG: cytochrome c oxidase subunit 3 [Pseudomonadales bacterium]|jgi:cytochrome c oxidase subunit 3|nr:cytochrome c oxidase subunit 3 [Pseudomonadales bacterium]MEC9222594.1 cytochrome c oxidase subunit 3 [Pseudomonadota bacterium]|tara:strand:- start:2219 stop:3103 length:885 start_codon:yes stop_codon:yes gene_type:complete